MWKTPLAIAGLLLFAASPATPASMEKAKALYQNNLLDDAKRELIDVLYAPETIATDRPLALYMLGVINEKQGSPETAVANWRELIAKYPQAPEAQLARENLVHPSAAVAQPSNALNAVGNRPLTGIIEVRPVASAGSEPGPRMEVADPMVLQATVPPMRRGLRSQTAVMELAGTDQYVCDKAHVKGLSVSRRPKALGGDVRKQMLDDVTVWPRGAAMVYVIAPSIATDWFRQDIDLTISAVAKSGEVLATRHWDDLTIGADNAASKVGLPGASSTKTPKLLVPMTAEQVERFEAEPFQVKIVIDIQE
jgi:hypothetical protein